MARITSRSKLQKRHREKSMFRCIVILCTVGVLFIVAFLLYQTDRALFRHKISRNSSNADGMKKSALLQQQQQQLQKQNTVRSVVIGEGDGKENEKGVRRVEFDLENLKGGNTFGTITIETIEGWAPNGVQRFWELIDSDFYINCQMFRVLPNFVAQFGIAAKPTIQSKWKGLPISDDPVLHSNLKNTITFAMSGKNSRTTQIFINFKDNIYLDKQGFAPIGRIVSGLEYISQINDQYKELPNQGKIVNEGNAYLDREYPGLTYISAIRVVDESGNANKSDDESEEEEEEENEGDDKKGDDKEESEEEEEEEEKGDGDDNKGDDKEEEEKGDDKGEEEEEDKGDGDDGKGDDKGEENNEGDDKKSEQ